MASDKIKDFAEKNVGKSFRIVNTHDVPRRLDEPNPLCKVVGYETDVGGGRLQGNDEYVLVAFDNPEDSKLAWRYFNAFRAIWLVPTSQLNNVWRIPPENLQEDKLQDIYPHSCSKCHSPARKVRNNIFCSNSRCKTWKQAKKMLPNIQDKVIFCPTCRENAITADQTFTAPNTFILRCTKGHVWSKIIEVEERLFRPDTGTYFVYKKRGSILQWIKE